MEKKYTVIGAGNAGCAVASDISLAGKKVLLYEFPEYANNLETIIKSGGISATGVGRTGFARLDKITTDIKEALDYADIVVVATQSLAHPKLAELMAPHIREEHLILFMPGSLGTLVCAKHFKTAGKKCTLAETYTSLYACRKLDGPGTIHIHRSSEGVGVLAGVFPAKKTQEALDRLSDIMPTLVSTTNVVECGLQNPNIIIHPAGTLLNLGRIEYTKGEFYLYREGFTKSADVLKAALDQEKCNLLKRLGLPAINYDEVKRSMKAMTFEEFKKISMSKGPFSVFDRYVTEDVPNGLNLFSSFGKEYGIEMPITDSVIHIFSALTGVNYFETGRSTKSLGVSGLSIQELKEFLYEGY